MSTIHHKERPAVLPPQPAAPPPPKKKQASAYVPMTDDDWGRAWGGMTEDEFNGDPRCSEKRIERFVLARIEAQGLVIVPKEPTAEMVKAGQVGVWSAGFVKLVYKAMLEATKEST